MSTMPVRRQGGVARPSVQARTVGRPSTRATRSVPSTVNRASGSRPAPSPLQVELIHFPRESRGSLREYGRLQGRGSAQLSSTDTTCRRHASFTANARAYVFFVILLAAAAFASCIFIYVNKLAWPPIRSDGFGYYQYLPSIMIDGNLSMKTPIEHMVPAWTEGAYGLTTYPETGKLLNKYTIGTALMQSPFFLVAHWTAGISRFKQNGFSAPYQIANIVSGIFFLCLGVIVLIGLLARIYGKLNAFTAILLVLLATNLFHYSTFDASFSHVYSFALISCYLDSILRYRAYPGNTNLICSWIGLLLGLIVLTRMPNIIVAIAAVGVIVEKNWRQGRVHIAIKDLAIVGVCFLCLFSLQIIYWRIITGHFLLNPYLAEGFNWNNPQLLAVLFGVRHGLLFWAPILTLAVFGIGTIAGSDRVLAAVIGAIVCLEIYICASWWDPAFGLGFGARPFVDMMPFLALPLTAAIRQIRERYGTIGSVSIWVTGAVFCSINLTLMYSYWRGYIPWGDVKVAHLLNLPGVLLGLSPLSYD
jgi:hypothetical protein